MCKYHNIEKKVVELIFLTKHNKVFGRNVANLLKRVHFGIDMKSWQQLNKILKMKETERKQIGARNIEAKMGTWR